MSVQNEGVRYTLTLQDLFSSKIKSAANETERLNKDIVKTQYSLNGLKTAFAGIGVGLFAREVVNTTAQMEGLRNQLNFASGSATQGAKDFEYIRQQSEFLGLDLLTAATAFSKFEGAARGTSLQGQGVRDVFEGVAQASTVMHLSAEQSEGAFRALEQMLSKGKVQAEELRGQLGERIPGAFQIAARAMGMTTSELDKFMSEGKLMAEEFLPKFSEQLKREFAGGIDAARESVTSNLNRMNNSWLELKYTLGELFLPAIIGVTQGIRSFVDVAKSVIDYVDRNRVAFAGLAAAIGTAAAALFLYNAYTKIAAVWTGVKMVISLVSLTAALEGVTVAQWLLNSASAFFAGLTGVGLFAVAAGAAAALAVGIYAAAKAQDSLNQKVKEGQQIDTANKAINPLATTANKPPSLTPTSSATAPKTGGTTTASVEAQKMQNFNIDIGNLIEKFTIQTTNMKESSAAIKDEVTKALISAVNDFQLMATK